MDQTDHVARIVDALRSGYTKQARKLAEEMEDVQEREKWFEKIGDKQMEQEELRVNRRRCSYLEGEDRAMLIIVRSRPVRIKTRDLSGKEE